MGWMFAALVLLVCLRKLLALVRLLVGLRVSGLI